MQIFGRRYRSRIRRLGPCDRLPLLFIGGWTVIAIPGNYLRVHGLVHGARQSWTLLAMIQILSILLPAAIAVVIAYSVIRQGRRPAEYGFSFKRGSVASLALLADIHVYLVISGRFVLSPIGGDSTPLQPPNGGP
jgi:hypothetical protein